MSRNHWRRSHLPLAILLALSLSPGCATVPGAASNESGRGDREIRLLALGDSYTIGEGVAPADRWPVQLSALLRSAGLSVGEPTILARTGWTTADLRAAMEAQGLWQGAVERPYDLVTLLIGVNDQYRGGAAASYRPAFRALLARVVELAGGEPERVIVVSIPNWGLTPFAAGRDRMRITAEIAAFNRANREVTQAAGVTYVDISHISDRVPDAPALTAPDGLHPSAEQYRLWAEAALPAARAAIP